MSLTIAYLTNHAAMRMRKQAEDTDLMLILEAPWTQSTKFRPKTIPASLSLTTVHSDTPGCWPSHKAGAKQETKDLAVLACAASSWKACWRMSKSSSTCSGNAPLEPHNSFWSGNVFGAPQPPIAKPLEAPYTQYPRLLVPRSVTGIV